MGGHDPYRSIFFVLPISQPIIDILTQNFQDMILGATQYIKNVKDDPGYLGKFWVGGNLGNPPKHFFKKSKKIIH